MTLDEKISYSEEVIRLVSEKFRNPVIMCSFGKDSMAMLYLTLELGFKWPILFHREPFLPKKYNFANHIIEDLNLSVYDYRPCKVSVMQTGNEMEIMNEYQIGNQTCVVPTGIEPIKEDEFLCGLESFLNKPLGTFNYPWDVCLIGHKATDTNSIQGDLNFEIDFKVTPGSASAAFPLRLWTDQDVWDYTIKRLIPIHTERYESDGETWKEKEDKNYNPDYFPICNRCFDKNQPSSVDCPKYNKKIGNISNQIRYFNSEFDYIKK